MTIRNTNTRANSARGDIRGGFAARREGGSREQPGLSVRHRRHRIISRSASRTALACISAALVATVAVVVACTTNTPTPTAVPTPLPAPTATPEHTATATAQPTSTPVPTPTASPSPTPTATATATPSPTATPTPVPDPLATLETTTITVVPSRCKIVTDADLSDPVLVPIADAVSNVCSFAEEQELQWADITLYLFNDVNILANVLEFNGNWNRRDATQWQRDPGPVAVFANKVLLVAPIKPLTRYVGWPHASELWRDDIADHTVRAMLHGSARDVQAPEWLSEGVAALMRRMATAWAEDAPYEHDEWRKSHADEAGPNLEYLHPSRAYATGLEAAELLAAHKGIAAFAEFYSNLRGSDDWKPVFEGAFGISVGEFYEQYRAHWTWGLPDLEIPLTSTEVKSWKPPVSLELEGAHQNLLEYCAATEGNAQKRPPVTPHFIKWKVGDAVRVVEECAARLGVQWLFEYAQAIGWPIVENDITVYFMTLEPLARAYALRDGIVDRGEFESSREFLSSIGGVAHGDVNFNRATEEGTCCDNVQLYSAASILIHENIHTAFQKQLNGLYTSRSLVRHDRGETPTWFIEGMATYFDGLISSLHRRSSDFLCRSDCQLNTDGARVNEIPLSDADSLNCQYECGALAIELLASIVGHRRIVDIYTLRRPGRSWQQAFEHAYGISVPDFYAMYDQHRLAGFPELDPTSARETERDRNIETTQASDDPGDRAVLVAVYNATRGDSWYNNTNWLSDQPLATWHGVTVDTNGHVSGISLSENGLRGTIPPEIGDLTNLKWLFLNGNQLSGTIPERITMLNNLEDLWLGENQLKGPIPDKMGGLTSLQYLAIDDNDISGALPDSMMSLSRLRYLDLGHNRLSGTIPGDIGGLKSLEVLNLNENKLTGELPDSIGMLKSLVILNLDDNRLTGGVPDPIGMLSKLQRLSIQSNKLDGTISPEIGQLTELYSLFLNSNRLTGSIPPEIGNSINMRTIALTGNELTGEIPMGLATLSHLVILYVSGGNQFEGCIPDSLRHITDHDFDRLNIPFCGSNPSDADDRDVLVKLYNATNGDQWHNNENWLSDMPLQTWHGVRVNDQGKVTELTLWDNNLNGTLIPEIGQLTALTSLGLGTNLLTGTIPPELGNLTLLDTLGLTNNDLTGEIPEELGSPSPLWIVNISGNEFEGCIPDSLRHVENNDFHALNIIYCGFNPSDPDDTAVLVKLYNATNGDQWLNNENWLSDMPLMAWHGVRVNDQGKVTELVLPSNGLKGALIPVIGLLNTLARLERLDLGSNELSGNIPSEIGNLTLLYKLILSHNELSGNIPSEIGNLTLLEELDLSHNELGGSVPLEIGQLKNLIHLSLRSNKFNGNIPSELESLPQVWTLWVRGNEFNGCIPDLLQLVEYNDLHELDLLYCGSNPSNPDDRAVLVKMYNATNGDEWYHNENWLSDAPLATWYGVDVNAQGKVKTLNLLDNNLNGTLIPEIGQLTALTSLDLGNNQLSGPLPSEIAELDVLGTLWLSGNGLSGPIPTAIGRLSNLGQLGLAGNNLSGAIPSEITDIADLWNLNLAANPLTGCIPPALFNIQNHDLSEIPLQKCN